MMHLERHQVLLKDIVRIIFKELDFIWLKDVWDEVIYVMVL
jgi:hypothetical protein